MNIELDRPERYVLSKAPVLARRYRMGSLIDLVGDAGATPPRYVVYMDDVSREFLEEAALQ